MLSETFKNSDDFLKNLYACNLCPKMQGRPVTGFLKKKSNIISIGQAPGVHEEKFGIPFAYTAGKTLFNWFNKLGISEELYRKEINMSAVCRCFPGKAKSGDRKPDKQEIENCGRYLEYEIQYHKPKLIIPIGKLAIDQLHHTLKYKLNDVIGKSFLTTKYGVEFIYIPLPHPSGLNAWNNTENGRLLIDMALQILSENDSIRSIIDSQ